MSYTQLETKVNIKSNIFLSIESLRNVPVSLSHVRTYVHYVMPLPKVGHA